MHCPRVLDRACWPGRRWVSINLLLIRIANYYKASRNSPSNTLIEHKIYRQKRGFSGSTQAMPPDLSRAFEILQTMSRSLGDRIHKPIYTKLCTTGCLTIGKGKWVLILDNMDDASFLFKAQSNGQDRHTNSKGTKKVQPLVEYLPQCPNGSILITTRSKGAALKIVEQHDIITVKPMDRVAGLELFEKKLGWHDDGDDVVELAAVLKFIPLVIV